MLEGLNLDSHLSIYYNLVFLGRRIVFVGAVFFLVKKNQTIWQALIFSHSSLLVLIFNAGIEPFETKHRNRIEAFNEFNVLIVGYFAMQILYSSWSPVMSAQVGSCILITILGGIALNASIILLGQTRSVKLLYLKCLMQWKKRQMKTRTIKSIAKEVKKEIKLEKE